MIHQVRSVFALNQSVLVVIGMLFVALLLLAAVLAANTGLLILQIGLQWVFSQAPQLQTSSGCDWPVESLTVVIPAYNESVNIEACLNSVLSSIPPSREWHVIVVDDASEDDTFALARKAVGSHPCGDHLVQLVQAGPRPTGERWVGKNWACTCAMEYVSSHWVLFIDADVRLKPDALRRALVQAHQDKADLLSLAPRLECGCLAEWMVQPIMASLLGLGFPVVASNDPSSPVAFAAGPFMLFLRSSYEAIGGHRALAAEVVEDLALARGIKQAGLRLRYLLALDAVTLRMYENLSSLWEGWTKNWFLGLDRNVLRALGAAAAVVLMFSVPWINAVSALLLVVLFPTMAFWWWMVLTFSLLAVAQQLLLRLWTRQRFEVPIRYWWLMGLGGLLVGAIGPASVWRTVTGRGWTWKGRALN